METVLRQHEPMEPRLGRLAAWIALVLGVTPVVLYVLVFGSIPTVTPDEAKAMLRGGDEAAVLVDVRPASAFSAGHIDGAINWPLEDLRAVDRPEAMPPRLSGKTLLVICDVGFDSCLATRHLRAAGIDRAFSVRGGIQGWIRSAAAQAPACPIEAVLQGEISSPPAGDIFDRWRIGPNQVAEFPFRSSPQYEQALAVAAFFGIKQVYTLLALGAAILLWRSRAPDLAALRWGMISFFLGENACAVNYLVFRETSYLGEYLHSLGMLLCFGFTAYAVLEGFDRRILKLSDPKQHCAALGLCRACFKHEPVSCGLRNVFFLVIPTLIVLALMLPTADWQDTSYNTYVFGHVYNYAHLRIYQLLENWYCAAAAVVLFAVSLAVLAAKGGNGVAQAKVFFAAGLGPLGFGLLRMILGGAYDRNRVWYLFWEEGTELLFVLAVCLTLWIFRQGLFAEQRNRHQLGVRQ